MVGGRGGIKADGGHRTVAAAPQTLAGAGRDEGFGRGPVPIPVGFVLRADLPQVDGEGRVPSSHVAFFLQPRIDGRQRRINGQAAHLHDPLEAEVGLLGAEGLARADHVIGQGYRVAGGRGQLAGCPSVEVEAVGGEGRRGPSVGEIEAGGVVEPGDG